MSIDTKELLKNIKDYDRAVGALQCNNETISGMIHLIKGCMSHMNVYSGGDYDILNEQTDKGIRICEVLERILLNDWYTKSSVITKNINEAAGWHYVSDGILPDQNEDVLFCNKVYQVFEGFLEKYDTSKPYLTNNNKIAFEEYPDGGAWFDYRFRSFHEMRSVVAWCYKPAAVSPKDTLRTLTKDDFKDVDGAVVRAYYTGKSRYLKADTWYNVKYIKSRNKVSVPLSENPGLRTSNSGVEFSMGVFRVKTEKSKNR